MARAAQADREWRWQLDLRSGVPVYRQIMDQVLAAIASGRLVSGDQLPTVRQLAVDLSINPNTVIRAYRELEIRGVLETEQGTGTFISHQKTSRDGAERQRRLSQLIGEFVARAGSEGYTLDEVLEQLKDVPGDGAKKRRQRLIRLNLSQVSGMAVALFVISVGAGFGLTTLLRNEVPFYAGLLIGVYLLIAIKVADQWEKVAVLRLGRFIGLRGPGLFHVIPIVDRLSASVDQRVR